MARNRKRAKERRARRGPESPVATTSRSELDFAPDPIEHAAPDAELAEAQLALGRPDLAEVAPADLEDEAVGAPATGDGEGGGFGDGAGFDAGDGGAAPPPGAGPLPGGAAVPAPRPRPGPRLVTFLQGSWRELQRVQWPDRRQVVQATGVVIGFVIVAGIYLGVADWDASKVMSYVLSGHF